MRDGNSAYFETEFQLGDVFETNLTNTLTFESGLQEITAIHKSSDHNILFNRELDDQHPISAITGLQSILDSKQDVLVTDANSGIIIENNYIKLDNLILDCGTSTTVI